MRWFYLRDEKKFPVACVVSEKIKTGIFFAVSTYNPSDTFDRKIAREVAEGRLKKGLGAHGTCFLAGDDKDIKSRIMNSLLAVGAEFVFPTRTRSAARLWLKNSKKREKVA